MRVRVGSKSIASRDLPVRRASRYRGVRSESKAAAAGAAGVTVTITVNIRRRPRRHIVSVFRDCAGLRARFSMAYDRAVDSDNHALQARAGPCGATRERMAVHEALNTRSAAGRFGSRIAVARVGNDSASVASDSDTRQVEPESCGIWRPQQLLPIEIRRPSLAKAAAQEDALRPAPP